MNVNPGAPRAVALALTIVTPLLASPGCSRDAQAMTPERLAALEREQADREAASPVAGRRFTRA